MHGDVLFTVKDEKAKESIAKHFRDADAYLNTILDLSAQAKEAKSSGWSLIYEQMKSENKKLPGGRLYVFDFKNGRVVDVGPAPRNRDNDFDHILDDVIDDTHFDS